LKTIAARVLAVLAAFAADLAASVGWLVNLRLRPDFTDFQVGLVTLGVPVALTGLTVIWLLARGLAEGSARWNAFVVVIGACVFAYAAVAFMCGPVACFVPGPTLLMGDFIVGGVALAALAHHLTWALLRAR
jgi:hypothetical protein